MAELNDMFDSNRNVWDRIYSSGGSVLQYPNENLVIITHQLFDDCRGKRLLDLGFGSGNNLVFLLRRGFACYGCEISPASLELTRNRLDELKLTADLKLFKDKLPYTDEFFDVVVSWQVLCYNSFDGLRFMLNEVRRVLKPGGKYIVTLIRKNDIIATSSDKIGEKTYKVNSSLPSQEGAIVFVPDTKKDIKELFSGFVKVGIGYFESDYLGRMSSHWVIWGEK